MKNSQWAVPIHNSTAIFTWDGKSLIIDDVVGDDSNDISSDEYESLREDIETDILELLNTAPHAPKNTTARIWAILEDEYSAALVRLPD